MALERSLLLARTTPSLARAHARISVSEVLIVCSVVAFYFEGALRKWVLSATSEYRYAALFSKEAFMVAAIVTASNITSPALTRIRSRMNAPIMLAAVSCFFAMLQEYNLVGAVMTARALIFLPYFACLLLGKITQRIVKLAAITIGICTILNCPLAVLQFFSSHTDFINCYVGGSNEGVATAGFSDNVRATGTFSYITGLGVASIIGLCTGIWILWNRDAKISRLFGGVVCVCACICALATVSRGPIIVAAAILVCWGILARRLLLFTGVGIAILLYGVTVGLSDNTENVSIFTATITRARQADDILARFTGSFTSAWEYLLEYPLGTGLGIGQTAGNATGNKAVVETEFARVILEVGAMGFAAYLWIYVGSALILLRLGRRAVSRDIRVICYCATVVCLLLTLAGVMFNHVTSIAFWGLFSVATFLATESQQAQRNMYRSYSHYT